MIMAGAALMLCAAANAQNSYSVTNIVTNSQDSHLLNPWGISRAASKTVTANQNQWWVSDNNTGLSTLYDANGTIVGLTVKIPSATTGPGSPTGTAAYNISKSNINFAFATLDGTISYWNSQTDVRTGPSCEGCHTNTATIMVNNNATGASYQGLTIAKNATSGAETFYAANANGGVEAYDAASFAPVTLPAGAFTDPKIPKTYSPAGIQAIGTKIWVTYNAIAGGGTGYVDAYNTNGKRTLRLQNGWFNQPWGVAQAPASGFGAFNGSILVGNTGSGWIGAYDATTGAFQGFLENAAASPITLDGLWGIEFGNGSGDTGPTTSLYFAAGGANLTTGAFGVIAVQ
jgi:uncharacterized protein (TIGR03118 family)